MSRRSLQVAIAHISTVPVVTETPMRREKPHAAIQIWFTFRRGRAQTSRD